MAVIHSVDVFDMEIGLKEVFEEGGKLAPFCTLVFVRYILVISCELWYNNKNERVSYMQITATELKTNIGRYLVLAEKQDIIVTKNNRPIVRLTNVHEDKISIIDSLIGIIPNNGFALEDAKEERLARQ